MKNEICSHRGLNLATFVVEDLERLFYHASETYIYAPAVLVHSYVCFDCGFPINISKVCPR